MEDEKRKDDYDIELVELLGIICGYRRAGT
jgi:hypothetical protein